MTEETIGRPRPLIAALPAYRPGKGAKQAEQEHGITNAIKLASNENPEEPLDPIVAAVAAAAHGINRYPDHRATAVREAIAARLDVGVEQVTIGTGSSGLLQQFVWAYVDPDDEVLYPWRSFEAYPIFTNLAGGKSVTVPLNDDLSFDADGLVGAVTPRTKLLMLATPNNPTGIATSTRDLAAIVEHIPSDVIIVIDEAYREFVDPAYGDPVGELVPKFANLVVTRTFSKAHGLAGLRLGYAIGDPRVIATVDKTLLPFAVNSLAQVAALAAIEHEGAIANAGAGHPRRARAGGGRTLPRRLEAAGPPGQLRLAAHRRRNRRRRARARTARRRRAAVRGRRRAGHDRHARRERPLPHRTGGGRGRGHRPGVTRSGFDVRPSRPALATAFLFLVVVFAASGIAYLFRWALRRIIDLYAGHADPTHAAGSLHSVTLFALAAGSVAVAATIGHLVHRRWANRTGIEAVAASARGEGRHISFRASTLRVAATWIVSAGLVSIGRESAIVESGGSLGSVIGRRSGGRGVALAAAGIAAAFSAAYHAPVAAVLYTEEHLRVRQSARATVFVLLGARRAAMGSRCGCSAGETRSCRTSTGRCGECWRAA